MSLKEYVKRYIPKNLLKVLSVWKNQGFSALLYKIRNRNKSRNEYIRWIEENENNQQEVVPLKWNPKISVVVPVYNVADEMLVACIDSVRNQTYQNWELCLVDDCSTMESVRKVLAQYEGVEKIKISYHEKNGHISKTTNDGIAMATGEYVGLMDCDDLLAVNALYEMAKLLNQHPEYDFIYSDEDKINEEGTQRRDPFFKPDWSPDTFMSYMYTCHFSIFRKSMLEELGGERIGYEGSQDYDLVLRLMEKTRNIGHVPKILYHWRMRKESTANDLTAKPYIVESTIKAKKDALERRGLKGHLECIEEVGQYRVVYEPKDNPLVSIIIPSKDNERILRQCIHSIREYTQYTNYEIIIVDNGSSEQYKDAYEILCSEYNAKYIYEPKDFNFSYMCNLGAKNAAGEYLLFLNDDIEITAESKEWLSRMLGQAQIDYTGAVGAKLLYPGTTLIQHAGVLNLAIGPGHAFHRFDDQLNCYWGRNILDYNYTVVTGACLMVKAQKFYEVDGFEETLPVAYNDVELCFKLVEHGYYNVLRNDVTLYHHESISRGYDEKPEKAKRLQQERKHLYELHPDFVNYDPCYNPNLTQDKGDCSINLNPKISAQHLQKITNINELEQTDSKMMVNIECVSQKRNHIKIKGWAHLKGTNGKKENVSIFLLKEDGTAYSVLTQKVYRPDVAQSCGKKENLAFAGFETIIELEREEDWFQYKVGIKIGNYYEMIRE